MRRLTLSAFAAVLILASSSAHAQATVNGNPADFDQYPSFLEVTTHLPNNVETVLRCGYGQTGSTIVPDAGYMETSVVTTTNFTRYQRIDNKIIITAPAPGVAGRFLLQVTEPNGLIAAKNCQLDLNSDTIMNCTMVQPFVPAAEATNQDQTAAQQCGSLFAKATPQMATTTFSAQKTDQFKNALRQKVAIIEAP
jgi:hypothetical protein